MKLHVIIPVYNVENYLCQCVESVLTQPFQNLDVILVDDGSPDRSGQICDELRIKDSRVHVIHQKNVGLPDARNSGIEYVLSHGASNNDYITFLDSDDAWIPEVLTPALTKHLRADWNEDVISFSGIESNHSMERFSKPLSYDTAVSSNGPSMIWRTLATHVCAKLYSVHLFRTRNLRFQHKQRYVEDKIFTVQSTFLAECVLILDIPLHIYRNNPQGIMSNIKKINPIDRFLPIINGWIQSDHFINSWEAETGRHCTAGYILAGIYFMEMAAFHYKRWGKRSEIEKVFREHPYYYLFEHMRPQDVSSVQYKDHDLLLKHPLLFQLKYNLIGALESLARLMLRLKPMANWWQNRKYPLTELPTIHSANEPL